MSKASSSLHFVKRPPPPSGSADTNWVPNTDVYVTESDLVIKVELSDVELDQLAPCQLIHDRHSEDNGQTHAELDELFR